MIIFSKTLHNYDIICTHDNITLLHSVQLKLTLLKNQVTYKPHPLLIIMNSVTLMKTVCNEKKIECQYFPYIPNLADLNIIIITHTD